MEQHELPPPEAASPESEQVSDLEEYELPSPEAASPEPEKVADEYELPTPEVASPEPEEATEGEIVEEDVEELLHGVNCDCHPFDAIALNNYLAKRAKKAFMATQRYEFILKFINDYQQDTPQPLRDHYSTDSEFTEAQRAWYCGCLIACDEAVRHWERQMLAQFQSPRKRLVQTMTDVYTSTCDFLDLQMEKLKEAGWLLLIHVANDVKDFVQIQLPIVLFFMIIAVCAFAFSSLLV